MMPLADVLLQLDQLAAAADTAFGAAADGAALEAARVEFLGAKSGRIKTAQKGLGQQPAAFWTHVGVETTLYAGRQPKLSPRHIDSALPARARRGRGNAARS